MSLSKKIKVVVLADVPAWTIPGLEHLARQGVYATWLEALIPAFKNLSNIDLTWISMSKEAPSNIQHGYWNQTFYVLRRWRKSVSIITGYYSEKRQIKRLVDEIKPDIIHAWGTEDVFGMAGAYCQAKHKVFTLQGYLGACLQNTKSPPLLMRLQARFEKKTIQSFQTLTGESPVSEEHLRSIHPSAKICTIDYGVSNEFFNHDWVPSDQPEIIFVGSVTEAKGIRELCDVMKRKHLRHINLKIVGDGDLVEELQGVSGPNVEWLGRLDRSELIKHMACSWVLVAPTYADTGPSVVKEARVIGLPVITTTAAGASHYIRNAQSGYVIEPMDMEALGTAISELCRNSETCLRAGRSGWETARNQLSAKSTARDFCELYTSLM